MLLLKLGSFIVPFIMTPPLRALFLGGQQPQFTVADEDARLCKSGLGVGYSRKIHILSYDHLHVVFAPKKTQVRSPGLF